MTKPGTDLNHGDQHRPDPPEGEARESAGIEVGIGSLALQWFSWSRPAIHPWIKQPESNAWTSGLGERLPPDRPDRPPDRIPRTRVLVISVDAMTAWMVGGRFFGAGPSGPHP